jgi:hypothetical protein
MTKPNNQTNSVTNAAKVTDLSPRPTISISRWRSTISPPRLVTFGWAPITPAASRR